MTSLQRREGRYQRRKQARALKAQRYQKTYDEIFTFENLWSAAHKCCRGSGWKSSIINLKTFMLREVSKIHNALMTDTRKFDGFVSFRTIEHGKERCINAVKVQERIIQKCLCENFLTDALKAGFIYDNGACLSRKGHDFTLKRLKKHLHDHYRKYGLEGGIYQFDFKGYFPSIPHEGIKKRLRSKIADDRVYGLMCDLVDDFKRLRQDTDYDPKTHGIGLGSEVSQIIGLEYASPIDHYIKDHCGIHGYGRYNDDGYVISNDLDELYAIRDAITALAEEIGIHINPKKDRITPFKNHSFTFLKVRFTLTKTGRVVTKLSRSSIRNMRRKLKVFRRWVDDEKISFEDVADGYQSWRSYARKHDSHDTVYRMDAYFLRLFEYELLGARRFINSHRSYSKHGITRYVGLEVGA